MKGGAFYTNNGEDIKMKDYVALFVRQSNSVTFTEKEVSEYYGWDYDRVDKLGNIYIHVDIEDMVDFNSDDLFKFSSNREIFNEWCGQQYFKYEMNPRLDDYGNVDTKKMNIDINHYLERHLKD